MSDPLPILKGEIKRLGFVSNEKLSLLAHFTENVEKIAVAVSCLEDCDNDEEKRDYLRYLISQPEQPIGESERKRKAVEELTKTTSRRKQWIVNGAMREMDWYSKYWLDPMDDEQNKSLLKKITDGSFTGLYGARASGKSTRILRIINHLSKDYLCNYSSMEQINTNNNNNFWKTFGRALSIGSASRSFDSCTSIASADDFQEYFSIKSWSGDVNDRIILFIDEFDKLYQFDENIRSEFLQILRFIKNATHLFVIYAIVIVGTFSILHLDSETSSSRSNLVSPFNVKDLVHNPNFSSERVLALFTEFGNENKIKIEDEIIADIYTQTNGHAGLVCLCGRTIEDNLFSSINGDRILKYDVWERFKLNSLMDEIALYQTFRRMINSLLNTEARKAVNFFRDYFLVGDVEDEVSIVDTDSAEFLAAEGVLIPVARNRSTFKLSSPMVRNLVFQRVIPKVFPFCPRSNIPYLNSHYLDILNILKLAIKTFDRDIIKYACERSFKMAKVRVNNAKSQPVPRESVYDSELYRVLWNWLSGYKFRITSQWHLIHSNGGKNKHSYSDIVIRSPYGQIFVLELLATATEGELNEHYNRVLNYARLLVADESWIVHFTCEDDYNKKPLWPSDDLLKRNLLVAHFCHDIHFKRVDMIVCWWSSKKDNRSTYQHSIRLD